MFLWRSLKSSTVAAAAEALARGRATAVSGKASPAAGSSPDAAQDTPVPPQPDR